MFSETVIYRGGSMDAVVQEIRCKFCNSSNTIKYGHFKNMQRWWCKDCRRKFADNSALPHMKTAINQICFAVGSYYEGVPLNDISKKIDKEHNIYISDSTIYKWVNKFSQKGADETKNCHPIVGDIWIANETMVKICGKNSHLIDIVDVDTQFILASTFSSDYRPDDIKEIFESAKDRASKTPECLIILESGVSKETLKPKYRIKNDDIKVLIPGKEESIKLAERIKDSYRDRNRVISSIKKQEYVQKIIDGWLFHYNYRRANGLLNGKTPAEKSEINFTNLI
jgi:transposase-like protein